MSEKHKPAKTAAKPAPKAAAPAPTVKIAKGDTGGNKAIVTRKTRPEVAESKPTAKSKTKALPVLPSSERAALVAREAYFMAERRGFSIGNDLADWLEAERIVDESYLFT